jgi:hypothetical protein
MGKVGGNDARRMLSCSFRRMCKLLAIDCGGLIGQEWVRACVRIFGPGRAAGMVSALKRLATEICGRAGDVRRGSAYVEVWK